MWITHSRVCIQSNIQSGRCLSRSIYQAGIVSQC